MIRLFILLFSLVIMSCGKRDIENKLINPFLGEWRLSNISCFYAGTLLMEEFKIPSSVDASFAFRNGQFFYDIEAISPSGQCERGYSGNYNIKGRSLRRGELSLVALEQTGGACTITLQEDKSGDLATIPFLWQTPSISNLKWSYDLATESMTIDTFNGFVGTSTIPQGCAGSCECFYTFVKIN